MLVRGQPFSSSLFFSGSQIAMLISVSNEAGGLLRFMGPALRPCAGCALARERADLMNHRAATILGLACPTLEAPLLEPFRGV